jgi:colanic acid biosynthesis glycosyl transferase WcaI
MRHPGCAGGRDGEGRAGAVKIAIVSQYYPPEPAPIPAELAAGLISAGHDVRVITGYPNYPGGRVFAGYRQTFRGMSEVVDGVPVRRLPLIASHSMNPFLRIANYVSFAVSVRSVGRENTDVDVVYVYATPMTVAAGARAWARAFGVPVVLHVQDLWPESVTGSSLIGSRTAKAIIDRLLGAWLTRIYRKASAIIAIAPTMRRLLVDRGAPADRVTMVFNWGREHGDDHVHPVGAESETGTRVLYAGNLGDLQDLETVIRAAALVRDLVQFEIAIVGAGVAEMRLRELAREIDAVNVRFFPPVPVDQMSDIYGSASYQLVPLRDLPVFRGTIPSKLASGLAAGLPVITTVAGDVSDLVRSHDVGFTAPPADPAALAEAFRAAHSLAHDGRRRLADRAQHLYKSQMSRDAGIGAIESVLAAAARTRTPLTRKAP